jgi:transcriptional regulator with PAS, ATPase and Fis domain
VELLETMHALKTGALIRASVLMGAWSTEELDDNLLEALSRFGATIGLAFQIQDDILDVEGDTGTLGKVAGADSAREGMVAKATGGTLFLDEIGDLKPPSQVKLLRLLQEQQYYPLGSDIAKVSNVRILCATHQDLHAAMAKEAFRSDLFYRLSVHQIDIPPLRRRNEDIPVLVGHFIEQAAESLAKKAPEVPAELLTLLSNHHFPGNVRELRALVFDAVARHQSGGVLSMKSFRKAITSKQTTAKRPTDATIEQSDLDGRFLTLKEVEQQHIKLALQRAGDNQGIAATLLGISRPALNRRLAREKKKSSNQ